MTVTTNVDLGLPFAEEPASTEKRDGAVRVFVDYELIPSLSTVFVHKVGAGTIRSVTLADSITTRPTEFPAHPGTPPTTVRPGDITARPSIGSCQRRVAAVSVEFTCEFGDLAPAGKATLLLGFPAAVQVSQDLRILSR